LFFASGFRGIGSERCKSCSTPLAPVLVPPSFRKRKYVDILQPIWEKASRLLREATTLCVIGYSFPAIDKEALSLFRDSLSTNRCIHTLAVCDPNTEAVTSTVLAYIGRDVRTVDYGSFEEMCRSLVGPWTPRQWPDYAMGKRSQTVPPARSRRPQ
jgi:hypothetical protein